MIIITKTSSDLNELVGDIVESNVIPGLSKNWLYNAFEPSTSASVSVASLDAHTRVSCTRNMADTNREYSIDIEFRKEGKGEEDIPYLMNKGWVGTTTRN